MTKIIKNADDAAEVLRTLWRTPKMTSLHFEFDAIAGHTPTIIYTVKCLSYSEVEVEDAEKKV